MTVVVTHSTPADGSFSSTGAAAWNADHTLSGVGTLAEQNANTVAITGGTINGTTVGGTTAAAGAFTTLSASSTVSGTGFSNYLASPPAIGGTAPAAGTFTTLTSNTQTNLSSTVNIRNGGTVTAITGTSAGVYSAIPTVTISAPTTTGGVQATATTAVQVQSGPTINVAGTGYAVNDTLTLVGGTFSQAAVYTIATISGSGVATTTLTTAGTYTVLPTAPIATTSSGAGTGCTLTPSWGVKTTSFTITNAGSGYVEQPTVTFSSGSAAAYATVGAIPTVRTLGSAISFVTPSSEVFRIIDASPSAANYLSLESGGGGVIFRTAGVGTNLPIGYVTKGTGQHSFTTAGSATNVQMQVTHTASAVNYIQVTGAATSANPVISAQGSDATVNLSFQRKGNGNFQFLGPVILGSNAVNYLLASGAASGSSPSVAVAGTDANIDLTLTPKGTGNVRFGTYTANMALTIQGYIEIKDSGGTVRRLAVIA
jgi:hypothetical protein